MQPKHQRGAIKKDKATLVSVWLPNEVLTLLDQEVQQQDSDRSKVIRKAIRRHLKTA